MRKFSQLNENVSYGRYNEEDITNHLKQALPHYKIHECIWIMDELDSSGQVNTSWNKEHLNFNGVDYDLEAGSNYYSEIPDLEITYFLASFNFRIEDLTQYEEYNAFHTTSEIYRSSEDLKGFPLQYFKNKIADLEEAFEPYSDIFNILIECGEINSDRSKNTNPELKMVNIQLITKDPILGNELLKMISIK